MMESLVPVPTFETLLRDARAAATTLRFVGAKTASLLQCELDVFFREKQIGLMKRPGDFDWRVLVDGRSAGFALDGSGVRAIIDACVRRVVSREWKRLSERLLRRNGNFIGGSGHLSRAERGKDGDGGGGGGEDDEEHRRASRLASALGYAMPTSTEARRIFLEFVARDDAVGRAMEEEEEKKMAAAERSIRAAEAAEASCAVQ